MCFTIYTLIIDKIKSQAAHCYLYFTTRLKIKMILSYLIIFSVAQTDVNNDSSRRASLILRVVSEETDIPTMTLQDDISIRVVDEALRIEDQSSSTAPRPEAEPWSPPPAYDVVADNPDAFTTQPPSYSYVTESGAHPVPTDLQVVSAMT